jgi:hypothetical protein
MEGHRSRPHRYAKRCGQGLCLRGRGKGSCHENPSTLEVEITLVRREEGVQLQWATAPPVLMQDLE